MQFIGYFIFGILNTIKVFNSFLLLFVCHWYRTFVHWTLSDIFIWK